MRSPRRMPKSPRLRTSGRRREKSSSISALHAPIPSSSQSFATASASLMPAIASKSKAPLSAFAAAFLMQAAFRKEMPKPRSSSAVARFTDAGSTPPSPARSRAHTAACAFEEICCPTTEWTSAAKRSGMTSRRTAPMRSTASPSRASRLFSQAISFSP